MYNQVSINCQLIVLSLALYDSLTMGNQLFYLWQESKLLLGLRNVP